MKTVKELSSILSRISLMALLMLCSTAGISQETLTPSQEYSYSPWGYTNEKGKTVIAPKFKTASEFYGNFAFVSDENGYFLINRKGKRCIEENCAEIKVLPDFENAFLIKFNAGTDQFQMPKYTYNIVRQDGKMVFVLNCGYIDFAGKLIIFRVDNGNTMSHFGIASLQGAILVAPVNYDLPRFNNGIAVVKSIVDDKEKYGIINLNGDTVAPFEYEFAGFTEGIYFKIIWAKSSDKKYHFYDSNGMKIENVVADEFIQLSNFKPAFAVKNGEKWGFFNGKDVMPELLYDRIYKIEDTLVEISVNYKIGIANIMGSIIIPAKYLSAKHVGESFYTAKSDKGTHLFNGKGSEIAVFPEDIDVLNFTNGIGLIRQNFLYGYINQTGQVIIPCQYDDAGFFRDGKAHVKKNDVFKGYIDLSGNRVSENELELEKAEALKAEELANAEKEERMKILDTYFPYQYSDRYCKIRLSKAPEQDSSMNRTWGFEKLVTSTAIINNYGVACQLNYRINNAAESQLAKSNGISLLYVYKKHLIDVGFKLFNVESFKFRGYEAIRYSYERDYVKVRAIAFQVYDNVFSIALMGLDSYYDDEFFEHFTSTFELK